MAMIFSNPLALRLYELKVRIQLTDKLVNERIIAGCDSKLEACTSQVGLVRWAQQDMWS